MSTYLPKDSNSNSAYQEGGGLYALGLIHANHGKGKISEYLLEQLKSATSEVSEAWIFVSISRAPLDDTDFFAGHETWRLFGIGISCYGNCKARYVVLLICGRVQIDICVTSWPQTSTNYWKNNCIRMMLSLVKLPGWRWDLLCSVSRCCHGMKQWFVTFWEVPNPVSSMHAFIEPLAVWKLKYALFVGDSYPYLNFDVSLHSALQVGQVFCGTGVQVLQKRWSSSLLTTSG